MVQKEPLETHNAFALRVQRLYKLGTGQDDGLSARDKKMVVETFLKGLPQEQTALRLVASDAKMSDTDSLANALPDQRERNQRWPLFQHLMTQSCLTNKKLLQTVDFTVLGIISIAEVPAGEHVTNDLMRTETGHQSRNELTRKNRQ